MACSYIYTTGSLSSMALSTIIARRRFLGVSQTPLLGFLPAIARKKGEVRCSAPGGKREGGSSARTAAAPLHSAISSMVAVVSAAAGPAVALVDERMSTEGTGLPFGLSNNLLGWILLGVFGLIWALYFVYTSDLDEDDDSGLSL
ncbi:hypothetical protein SAY86_002083 [Trapa natans]|uniref:PSII 6.1 kDa protein n=1 Tax=Trapa natans TaxID=22666 RepID=A0AAN7LIL2_TRANT|nr:hypothetical protein SAY86_002083 [Trapa natans]